MNKNCCQNNCEDIDVKDGTTDCSSKDFGICGKKQVVINKHYHKNNITRYNDIIVTERNYVKNYVKDCNRIHHKVENICQGTEYLGATCIDCGCSTSECCCKPNCGCQKPSNPCVDTQKCGYGWCNCDNSNDTCCNDDEWC